MSADPSGKRAMRLLSRLGERAVRGALATTRFLFGVPARPRRLPRWAWLTRSDESNWRFALVFGAVYLAYLVWGHMHHEPWRDETHPWIVAREAEGFWDILMGDRRYDGHPPGWYWALRLTTLVTRDVWGLHATTIVVSAAAAVLFLRFAPFTRPLRLLLVSGYLLAYEYGVLSRNYTLGVLFVFAFASALGPLKPRPLLLGLLLAGVALSSVYGAILACALLLVLLAESTALVRREPPGTVGVVIEKNALAATLIVLVAVAVALWSCRPPDPNPYAPGVSFLNVNYAGFEASLTRLAWSVLPLRVDDDITYWALPDQVWRDHPDLFHHVQWCLLGAMLLCLAASPVELVAFVLGASAIALVALMVYPGSSRHWGHYYILFLALCWTARSRKRLRRGWLIPIVLCVIGLCQSESLFMAARLDARYVFSGGPEAAARLREKDVAGLPIVGGPDWAMPAVMVGLDRTFISCETEERNQTLVFHARRKPCSPHDLLRKAMEVSEQRATPVLVVVIGNVPSWGKGAKVELLMRTRRPTAVAEDFSIYRVQKVRPAPAASAPD